MNKAESTIEEELKPIALSFFDMIDEIFEIGTCRPK